MGFSNQPCHDKVEFLEYSLFSAFITNLLWPVVKPKDPDTMRISQRPFCAPF